jgi:hypothetical protein
VDELTLRGGGSTAVATDSLFVEAARLAVVAHILDGWAVRVGGILRRLDDVRPGEEFDAVASGSLDIARAGLAGAAVRSSELGAALIESAEQYAAAEWWAATAWEIGGRIGAAILGMATPTMLVAGASAAALTLPGVLIARQLVGPERADAAFGRLLEDRGSAILSDPAFVEVVRAAADSSDEYLAGLLRNQGMFMLGGALRAPEDADLLLGAAAIAGVVTGTRVLVETPLRVTRVDAHPDDARHAVHRVSAPADAAAAPRGVGDLADRIPRPDTGEPQVRIERYGTSGDPRWIVYSSGTVDFGAVPRSETHDMTSNLHTVAEASRLDGLLRIGPDSGAAEGAVRAAMAEAGVESRDPVIVVGHSAGGVVAANLAAAPDLNVVAGVSFGGPVGHVDTRGTPLLSVEHTEDFVPATAGAGHASSDRLVVERTALDPGATYDDMVPAHSLTTYRVTAEYLDEAQDPRVLRFRGLIDDVTAGLPPETTYWHAERVAR